MRSEAEIRRACRVHIRWMIRRDYDEVLEIEQLCFPNPWTEDDFIRALRQRFCIGKIAETEDQILGFMVYELHKTRIDLLNLAVHPSCWRRSVGSQLVGNLKDKLTESYARKRLTVPVREGNTDAQLFFRAMDFRCVNVMRDYYDDTDEAAYLMQYRIPSEVTA